MSEDNIIVSCLKCKRKEVDKSKSSWMLCHECLFEEANNIHENFHHQFNNVQREVHENAISKGWWDTDKNNGEIVALIHSELSEVLEAFRTGNKEDVIFPGFTEAEIELADVVIRCMDFAQARNFKLAKAILEKMKYNKGRPYKHGKLF